MALTVFPRPASSSRVGSWERLSLYTYVLVREGLLQESAMFCVVDRLVSVDEATVFDEMVICLSGSDVQR